MERLKGAELLSYVQSAEKLGEKMPKAALVSGAGYKREDGRVCYVDFYEALLEAKGQSPIQPEIKGPEGFLGLPNEGPAIYVACLAFYNDGELYGHWVNLSLATTADEIQEAIDCILENSPKQDAEEYAIHDSQGLPAHLQGEWPDLEAIAEWLDQQDQAEQDGNAEPFKLWLDYNGQEGTYEDFTEAYCGSHEDGADYAHTLAQDCGDLSGCDHWPFTCIDWERAWRDLEMGGDNYSIEHAGEFYVFRNC